MIWPDRIWVTHEDCATSWAGSFRAFKASDLDHGDEYPGYIRADLVQSLIQAAIDILAIADMTDQQRLDELARLGNNYRDQSPRLSDLIAWAVATMESDK